jgi:branched-subunit amino acid ABC-type transport system permease component
MITDFAQYALRGLPLGCVFALLAVGLVLSYKTSGVFNLAFAAQGYASAAVFFELRKEHEWALLPAGLVAIVGVGVGLALFLDVAIYRHQRTASPLAKLVTSLGLLVAIPQIVLLVIGTETKLNPPPLWPVRRVDDLLWPQDSAYALDAGQIVTLLSAGVVVLGLLLLFGRTSLGLRMRAVVESPRLLQLQGVDSSRVALGSTLLSSLLASLAGVLIAPLFAQLKALDFFALLVAAIAAAVAARLSSIAVAVVAGVGLGVLQAELAGFLPTDSVLATGLRPSLPFVVLFCLLLVLRSLRTGRSVSDPLAGVESPPVSLAAGELAAHFGTATTALLAVGAAAVALVLAGLLLDELWLGLVAGGVGLSVVMLSIVLTVGVGRTISLCQGTFAAMGAFTTAQLTQHDWPVTVAILAGAVVAATAAAVLAYPVLRLPGIYAALATLAFALMFEGVLVPLGWVSGGPRPLRVPRPVILGWHVTTNFSFLLLASGCLAVLGLAVVAIRRGTTGRFLDAHGGSTAGAAAVGINATRHRFVVFVLGGAVAGVGGGLIASYAGFANYQQSFTFFFSLVWVTIVVTLGARSVAAAAVAGVMFFVFPEILGRLFAWPGNYLASHPETPGWARSALDAVDPSWAGGVAFVLFGLGALSFARHPEGVLQAQLGGLAQRLRARGKHRGGTAAPPATGDRGGRRAPALGGVR